MNQHHGLPVSVSQFALYWLGLLLSVIAILVGWFVPEFYDWTGSDQSRLAPVVTSIGIAILGFDLAVILGLISLRAIRHSRPSAEAPKNRLCPPLRFDDLPQFRLWQVMTAVTLAAVLLALGRWYSPTALGWCLFVSAFVGTIWIGFRNPSSRWLIGLIAWVQFAPFIWLTRKSRPSGDNLEILEMLPALPTFVPVSLISAGFQLHFAEGAWINMIATACCMVLGAWLATLGPTRTLVYAVVLWTCSIFGSFAMHMLMRA